MKKILLVDRPELRTCYKIFLNSKNVLFMESSRADEALKIADDSSIDLMIISQELPDADGIDTIKKIRESGRTFPVILSTKKDIVSLESLPGVAYHNNRQEKLSDLKDKAAEYISF